MADKENSWDKLLQIRTDGREDTSSDEFISYLMTVDKLTFYDEIECADLCEMKDRRERITVFEVTL